MDSLASSRGKAEEGLKRRTKPATCTWLEGAAADLLRTKSKLIAENALLRLQLIVLEWQVKHPRVVELFMYGQNQARVVRKFSRSRNRERQLTVGLKGIRFKSDQKP